MHHSISQVVHCRPQWEKSWCVRYESEMARLPSVPCKINFIAFVRHIDPSSCFCTLILHSMLTSCHAKWSIVSSKFQRCLESLRGKVCNGETLRKGFRQHVGEEGLLACQLTHTDGRCVKGISHTPIRGSPPGQQWEEMGLNERRKSGRRS